MQNDGRTVIGAENLSFSYDGNPVLREVSFAIEAGDFVSVIGPNGAGKTTLAKLILGLLQPSGGTITVLGGTPEQARSRIGYVPQYMRFDQQYPITVSDVALMGRLGRRVGFFSRKDRDASRQALAETGMEHHADRSFTSLSGGQRQRVLIARALAGEPAILLMDEPTANVDTAAEESLKDLLKQLNRKMTIIIVTHDLGFVGESVNRVLCVKGFAKLHNTRDISPEMIRELFGAGIRYVDHDSNATGHHHD